MPCRTRGCFLAGTRSRRGPNVHLIGAILATDVVEMECWRGSFTAILLNDWVTRLLETRQDVGNELSDLVIVFDNTLCNSRFETPIDGTSATLLRWGPYFPMLNPIEIIWSKINIWAKVKMRIRHVRSPGVIEQRFRKDYR